VLRTNIDGFDFNALLDMGGIRDIGILVGQNLRLAKSIHKRGPTSSGCALEQQNQVFRKVSIASQKNTKRKREEYKLTDHHNSELNTLLHVFPSTASHCHDDLEE